VYTRACLNDGDGGEDDCLRESRNLPSRLSD
jgi:hypothetical protein